NRRRCWRSTSIRHGRAGCAIAVGFARPSGGIAVGQGAGAEAGSVGAIEQQKTADYRRLRADNFISEHAFLEQQSKSVSNWNDLESTRGQMRQIQAAICTGGAESGAEYAGCPIVQTAL
ncbi:hypothetical protein, partial [Salmonella enterica]|uniref:hypothetical protein n=1 Tax=Salmonella enterica TaxID=28901 RepID=UPI001C60F28F